MSEYVFILLDLDLKNKEYREIIKTDPEKVKSGVILKIAKQKPEAHGSSLYFLPEVWHFTLKLENTQLK